MDHREGPFADVSEFQDMTGIKVAMHKIVCPVCEGTGSHVNPAIDAHGLNADDFADDDFREGYLGGRYDVTCAMCHGRNVVDAIDFAASPEGTEDEWDAYNDAIYSDMAEREAERRMGA
jgi:hypothetical protein